MFSHYFELRAIPQLEITETEVINKIMQSLHEVLVNYQGNIAVSFPLYNVKKTLGGVIRIFGHESILQKFIGDLQKRSIINNYSL